jgi:hypothetical protein
VLGRRLLEILVIGFLIWFCLSLKFFLGVVAGFILAGEVGYSVWGGRKS